MFCNKYVGQVLIVAYLLCVYQCKFRGLKKGEQLVDEKALGQN